MNPSAVPGFLAAFVAGLLSFLSPCVLPLIPVYLSFISGETATALREGTTRRLPLLIRTLFFVAGFTAVFVTFAIVFGGGMRFAGNTAGPIINRIAGILVLILAVNTIFDFIPFLRGEIRLHPKGPSNPTRNITIESAKGPRAADNLKAILLGMAFAAGWTPCIGPILSSLLLYAGQGGNIARAVILLALYSAGLGLPFIAAGLFFDRMLPLLGVFKRHMTAVRIISGLLLFAFALALLGGGLSGITAFLMKTGYALEEYSQTGPAWLRGPASVLARWFTFQGI